MLETPIWVYTPQNHCQTNPAYLYPEYRLQTCWKLIRITNCFTSYVRNCISLSAYTLYKTVNQVNKSSQRWNLKNLSRGLNPPKSAKTRFKFSAGLNLETFDTILTIFKPRFKFKPPLKFFKFGHWKEEYWRNYYLH